MRTGYLQGTGGWSTSGGLTAGGELGLRVSNSVAGLVFVDWVQRTREVRAGVGVRYVF